MFKKIAQTILKFSAKLSIRKNNYKIIAITGSVGKTSTKKAVSLVMRQKYRVLSSEEEGYNTEIGVPLVLLEKKVPKGKFGWFALILTSPLAALKKRNYDFCVLEMGADKPGDIEYLTAIARPDIAVVTNVSRVHLVEFNNIKEIASEKEKILSRLEKDGVAVLNIDNQYIASMRVPEGVKKITFGKKSDEIKIIKQNFTEDGTVNYFKINGRDITISSTALGEHILYVFAIAIAVGISQKIEISDITAALEKFKPAKSRLNVIQGIRGSTILDDSYNANPTSMKNALDVLAKFGTGRKIAVLGSMNELGSSEEKEHKEIGAYLGGKCDILVTVGEAAKKYPAPATVSAGIDKDNVYSFGDSIQAGDFLQKMIQKGDIILVKGSQNKIRLEKAVKIIMQNPDDAPKVLCRQTKEWEKRG